MNPVIRALSYVLVILSLGVGTAQSHALPSLPLQSGHATATLQLVVASSELALGRNRFTFGVLNNNHPVERNSVRTVFYSLKGQAATVRAIATSRFNHFAKGLKSTDANSAAVDIGGVFVAYPTFEMVGQWGVEADVPINGKTVAIRAQFTVVKHSSTPAVGTQALRSHNPTVRQLPLSKLDSNRPPTDMHKLSIAQALGQHKPLLILFATGGFCTSRMCGPMIQTTQQLEQRYRSRVNFVHIEVYKNANPQYGLSSTMKEWHLQTEPWVFVVDRHGTIRAKFEGPTAGTEIAPVLKQVISTQ